MRAKEAIATLILVLVVCLSSVPVRGEELLSTSDQGLSFDEEIILSQEEQDWLAEGHVVRIRIGQWMPFMIIDDEENVSGISVDYIEGIFNKYDIQYEWVVDRYSFTDALGEIRDKGSIDMMPTVAITEERMTYMLFTDIYISSPWVIFTQNEEFISSLEDLRGKTVAVPEGYVITDLIQEDYPDIELKVISGGNMGGNCLQLLSTGQVDAYVGNLTVGSYIINTRGYNNVKVAAPTEYGNHENAMGIRSDWPELVSIINKELETVDESERNNLYSQWMSVRYEHGIRLFDIIKWSFLAFIAVGVGFFFFYRRNRRLKRLSMTDQMTGLFNHGAIFEILNTEITASKRYGEPLTILLFDIDDFKRINDQYGHAEGDKVIKNIAESLKQAVRESDFVGRYGGEEFLVITPRNTAESATGIYWRFVESINKLYNEGDFIVTASCGIAEYNGQDIDDFIKLVDKRLYEAKAKGKNCFVAS
ncbi:diguanylate cyclase [Eubacteriaceae bacterium ES3]|nr:diguanylate cyclase [Eubacteriaceae bacterium ES3]